METEIGIKASKARCLKLNPRPCKRYLRNVGLDRRRGKESNVNASKAMRLQVKPRPCKRCLRATGYCCNFFFLYLLLRLLLWSHAMLLEQFLISNEGGGPGPIFFMVNFTVTQRSKYCGQVIFAMLSLSHLLTQGNPAVFVHS